ncbi:hypothetical protein [Kribbella catacumbae]|uniref:hypothetical protein n=1 Tax=Kribbella catacumbae TaxID=460086 RepID=UPI0012FC0E78|nr:hypothetical protein [Kribbella catacumbae]
MIPFLGLLALAAPWLAEAATAIVLVFATCASIYVRRGTTRVVAKRFAWLSDYGIPDPVIRDLTRMKVVAELATGSFFVVLALPILAMISAAAHRLDAAVYPAALLAFFATSAIFVGGVILLGRLRESVGVLAALGYLCDPATQPGAYRQPVLSRWNSAYMTEKEIWMSHVAAQQPILNSIRQPLRRLLRRRSRYLSGIDGTHFMKETKPLFEELIALSRAEGDVKRSPVIVRVVRLVALGDIEVLGPEAVMSADPSDHRAWNQWSLRRIAGVITVGLTRFDGQGWCGVGSRYLFGGGGDG